jgi:hypothetical protein
MTDLAFSRIATAVRSGESVAGNMRRRDCMLALAAGAWSFGARANTPPELGGFLGKVVLSGQKKFTFFGFAVYDASLWVEPGFRAQDYERHGFALDLLYQRDFSNADITRRSIDEMTRLATVAGERKQTWEAWLRTAFPDVRKGDRITGIHRPSVGAVFLTNGRLTGRIDDPEFARLFFGIWLSPDTSEPALRQALLGQATR